MHCPKIGIIGGGASGLMSAIIAARNGAEVTILEHKDRVGKKILMTGNGKCNLTNLQISSDYYYSSELDYAMSILNQISPSEVISLFRDLGLYTKEKKDGGIYPVAEQAAVVLDCLMQSCTRYHIKTVTMVDIEKITPNDKVIVSGIISIPDFISNNQPSSINANKKKNDKKGKKEKLSSVTYHQKPFSMTFDSVILACGSKAASVTGSDGSGYNLAKQLGLHIEPVVPALIQLHCEGDFFKAIAGVRAESEISLYIDGKYTAKEYGELQITDYGISGIPVFQLSRLVAYGLQEKKTCEIQINFLPFHMLETSEDIKKSLYSEMTVLSWAEGFINKKLAMLFIKQNNMLPDHKVSDYSIKQFEAFIHFIRNYKVLLTQTNPFENAQVCAGGVSLTECNKDLSLKKYSNIYAIGELLDVDGKCGGYNLQWAWVTGILAGKSSSQFS